jgi:Holliday junction resolvasome RuvABC endonuclease subunit
MMAADPSINHTGWAIINAKGEGEYELVDSGVVLCKKKQEDARYGIIARKIYEKISEHRPERILIERPTYEKTERGEDLWRSGGILKLSMTTGAILGAATANLLPVSLITAWQWKKTVSKDRMLQRVEELFPHKVGCWAREDEWEAVGLALYGVVRDGGYEVYTHGIDKPCNVQDRREVVLQWVFSGVQNGQQGTLPFSHGQGTELTNQ